MQNLRPGAAEALGLGADALRAAQAESGLMSVTGEPQGLPQKVGATISDTATGCPELATDPRFLTNELRVVNRPAMKLVVSERLSQYGTRECVDLLTRNNIVVGVVRSYSDTLKGEDFRASSMVVEAAPNGDVLGYPSFGLPYELFDTPRPRTQAAPAHGAHTEEVLRDAGSAPARSRD